MTRKARWYKRDVDAWRSGTRGMSIELRGFYSEILDALWDRQGPIESDPAKLAVTLTVNPRTVRKLLPQLSALGKVVVENGWISNPRMMREMEFRAEFERNSSGIPAELEPKVAKNPLVSRASLDTRKQKTEGRARGRARPPSGRGREILDRIYADGDKKSDG